jgi:8-oxo-dGTP pyrophosphatase MutT (NUDIX family)
MGAYTTAAMRPPAPASTVVLIRPAAHAFEVFLVRRHDNVPFMGGAHVFPGGRVDFTDHIDDAQRWCDGIAAATARLQVQTYEEAIAFHVAAIRELFEEAGVLLARDEHGKLVAFSRPDEQRFEQYRRQVHDGGITLRELIERERLRLALDALILFAHWVTPVVESRRFDTRFFLAFAPDTQQAAHDNRETTSGEWIEPADAISRCLRGEIALPPPTWTTLRALSRCHSVKEALAWASAQTVVRIEPCFVEQDDGTRMVMLPGDPLCERVEGFIAEETRFLLKDGRWQPLYRTANRAS